MILAIRLISAGIVLGFFISRSINKLLIIPVVFAFLSASVVLDKNLFIQAYSLNEVIINIFIGISLGIVFSLPVLAIDLLSEYFAVNLRIRSFKLCIVLALLLKLFDLEYLPYFFSLIVKSNALVSYQPGFSQLLMFFMPCTMIFLSAYLFFVMLSTLSRSITNNGIISGIKIILAMSLLVFYINNSNSLLYDLMKDVAKQASK